MKTLARRNILVTGAAGYLGTAICRRLAAAGAELLLNDRAEPELEKLAALIQEEGGRARPVAADLADRAAVAALCTRVQREIGALHGLVHAAHGCPALATERERFAAAADLASGAAFDLVDRLRTALERGAAENRGGASVVLISSMYGAVSPDFRIYRRDDQVNPPHYGAAKAGQKQLARYLAVQLAPLNIRVNSISPGPFPHGQTLLLDPDFERRLAERVPLGRIGRPEEIAGPVLFLLSDDASFLTGADLALDGGWTAW